jgi:ribosome-associated protein
MSGGGAHRGDRGMVPMEPTDGVYRSARGLRVAADAVEWAATRSGGPGGQHANTSDTAVTVTIDVAAARLSDTVRARVLAVAGATITASSATSRSQWRNRQVAWQAAFAKLDVAAAPPPPPRAPTKPSRAAKANRLADKRRAGERKRERQRPRADD